MTREEYLELLLGIMWRDSEDIQPPTEQDLWVCPYGETFGLYYNCNDMFDFATSDSEHIPENDVEAFLAMNAEERHKDVERRRGRLCIKCRRVANAGLKRMLE